MAIDEQNLTFQQFVIREGYNFLRKWDDWAANEPDGPNKTFHLAVIRLVRGGLKAWRLWLIETSRSRPL